MMGNIVQRLLNGGWGGGDYYFLYLLIVPERHIRIHVITFYEVMFFV